MIISNIMICSHLLTVTTFLNDSVIQEMSTAGYNSGRKNKPIKKHHSGSLGTVSNIHFLYRLLPTTKR